MRIIAPDYYKDFKCIADRCRHTCCVGWEVDIDSESFERFKDHCDISKHINMDDHPHFSLLEGERCPFLNDDGLCRMIISHGEEMLCQICRDHPRFRNYWTGSTEIGLGLVCEEAARLILGRETPMKLTVLSEDRDHSTLPDDEQWLFDLRNDLLSSVDLKGPEARLLEYLIFRHLPNALYDGRLEERIEFINRSFNEIADLWDNTDGSLDEICEAARAWSYDAEYDEDELEKRIASCKHNNS